MIGEDSGDGSAAGGERRRLEAVAGDSGLASRVRFLGAVEHEDLADYYALADICVVPSRTETFGLVALEAQALGTPVVASAVGGLTEIIEDGSTGILVAEREPQAFAAAIAALLDDAPLRERMGDAARAARRLVHLDARRGPAGGHLPTGDPARRHHGHAVRVQRQRGHGDRRLTADRSIRRVTCSHCGAAVPDGPYCTRCGAHREKGPLRLHHFALRPGEHLATPAVLSTLLPHLDHERVHVFRWALLAGMVAGRACSPPPAWSSRRSGWPRCWSRRSTSRTCASADVFADAPVPVLLATVGRRRRGGGGLTAAADALGKGLGAGGVILLATATAVVAELLKPLAPLLLLRRRFPNTLDGLVFGVAAGVGYALAQTVVNLTGSLGGVASARRSLELGVHAAQRRGPDPAVARLVLRPGGGIAVAAARRA